MSALYTPAILRLALACGDFPPLEEADAHVERRSPLCGSHIRLDLKADGHGRVRSVGFALQACAVGQAAAALIGREVSGRNAEELASMVDSVSRWLDDPTAALPDWPGIEALAPVRGFPARRGAALLPFEAAADAAMQASTAAAA